MLMKFADIEIEVTDGWESAIGQIVRSTKDPSKGYLVRGYDPVTDEVIIVRDAYDALVSEKARAQSSK
jgi:hypothetical protein